MPLSLVPELQNIVTLKRLLGFCTEVSWAPKVYTYVVVRSSSDISYAVTTLACFSDYAALRGCVACYLRMTKH